MGMAPQLEPITEHTVAQAVRDSGIDAPARFVEVTGSTNADLLRQTSEAAPAWTVLVAGEQLAGRGRLGRTWVSKPGQSLLVSVLLRPSVPAERAPLLSLAAGVAMVRACGSACGVQARCKWPNDVVVGGRKLAGILAEAAFAGSRLDHVVIGAGVNLWQRRADFPQELHEAATSVALEGGRPDALALLREYLRELAALCAAGLDSHVIDPYRRRCATIGRTVRAQVSSGTTVEGVAEDIGPSGDLVLRTTHGERRITFGEIVHLD